MLNEILLAKFENEVSGKEVTFPAREKKALKRKYEKYFGDGKWRGSIFDLYLQFLEQQAEKGKAVEVPENSFDVYDLAALAYLYKRIKENDPVREASHVVIDEAQDFGMMAYQVLHYCLRDCTYTIMGDTSQNIHFSYGLNDWEELKKLILTGTYDAFGVLRKSYRNTVEISILQMKSCGTGILRFIRWSRCCGMERRCKRKRLRMRLRFWQLECRRSKRGRSRDMRQLPLYAGMRQKRLRRRGS